MNLFYLFLLNKTANALCVFALDIWAASNGNQARQGSIHHWVWYERKTLFHHTDNSKLHCLIIICNYMLWIVCQVDFDAPLGYKEPERRSQHQEEPTVSKTKFIYIAV